MAQQVKSLTSEALEAAYRQLTPSQSGFTEDLMASNTIIPVLDLTAQASGEVLRQDLQSALAFSNITSFDIKNATTNLVITPGYYRIFGSCNANNTSSVTYQASFSLTDGISSKKIIEFGTMQDGGNAFANTIFDFIVKMEAGVTLSGTSSGNLIELVGSTRQLADISGTLS